ncbi:MAG: SDR family oxidoreductase [Polyangiales bacterium]
MRTLVLGGAGFIGSHLVDRLLSEGHRVRVLDNLSTGKRENLAKVAGDVELRIGDIRDEAALASALADVEVVFHQAAIVSVTRSVEEPLATQSTNLTATLQLLVAARAANVRRVVFASSAAVYGAGSDSALTESMPTLPQSPYGLEKLAGEHYLRIWRELHGLESVALRYFNVFGARQDPSSPYSGVISIFAERIARGVAPTIYGDGEQTRDFVHVSNVVQANVLAGFTPSAEGVFNVACGETTSLNRLFTQMCQLSGVALEPQYGPARSGDIRHSSADISRAAALLGYVPRVTLPDGLAALFEDLRDINRNVRRER